MEIWRGNGRKKWWKEQGRHGKCRARRWRWAESSHALLIERRTETSHAHYVITAFTLLIMLSLVVCNTYLIIKSATRNVFEHGPPEMIRIKMCVWIIYLEQWRSRMWNLFWPAWSLNKHSNYVLIFYVQRNEITPHHIHNVLIKHCVLIKLTELLSFPCTHLIWNHASFIWLQESTSHNYATEKRTYTLNQLQLARESFSLLKSNCLCSNNNNMIHAYVWMLSLD